MSTLANASSGGWEQAALRLEPLQHIVQLHDGERGALTRSAGRYLSEGLAQGDALLVIAGPERREALVQRITAAGHNAHDAVEERRLVLLDAEETLARFLVNGHPEWDRFQSTMEAAMRNVWPRAGHNGLRAYGEMVDILWKAGKPSAAIRLEEFWNRLLRSVGFKLFCAYSIDVFGDEFHSSAVRDLVCAHTHVVPCGENGSVESAVDRAMEEILGSDVEMLRLAMGTSDQPSFAVMPRGESTILSLRASAPQRANEVLSRARQHYQTERRFQALVENSSDAIFLANAEGKVLYASASTTRVLGYEPEELIGRNGVELIHPDDVERTRQTLGAVLTRPRCPVQAEARVRRKDGRWCWIESTISNLLHEPDIRAIVANYRDVSDRKAAEEEKRKTLEDLARSNAELKRLNDDLNQFAYSASHDLQEPLRMMTIYSQMLQRKYKAHLDADAERYIEEIVLGAKRMNALLKDLLAYTRAVNITDPENNVTADANAVLGTALRNLSAAIAESGADITHDTLPLLRIREVHLLQILQNLLGNAIKYRSKEPARVHISATLRGTNWEISVKDNGIGVPQQYAKQIFRVFKRLHSSDEYEGTGIGLAICQRIIERHGGQIWVDSPNEQGAVFHFTLPGA